jgi:hypothetical protein
LFPTFERENFVMLLIDLPEEVRQGEHGVALRYLTGCVLVNYRYNTFERFM